MGSGSGESHLDLDRGRDTIITPLLGSFMLPSRMKDAMHHLREGGQFMKMVEQYARFLNQTWAGLGHSNQMLVQLIATLLEIAQRPGITPVELGHRLKISDSAAGRNVSILGREGWPRGKGGHNLISYEQDPLDAKLKRCYLNKKGERLLREWMGVESEGGYHE
jgi:DNA-binding MarR family transcriptional regulator